MSKVRCRRRRATSNKGGKCKIREAAAPQAVLGRVYSGIRSMGLWVWGFRASGNSDPPPPLQPLAETLVGKPRFVQRANDALGLLTE
eukprot:gene11428-biopygen1833